MTRALFVALALAVSAPIAIHLLTKTSSPPPRRRLHTPAFMDHPIRTIARQGIAHGVVGSGASAAPCHSAQWHTRWHGDGVEQRFGLRRERFHFGALHGFGHRFELFL